MPAPAGPDPSEPSSVRFDLRTLGTVGLFRWNTGELVLGPGKPLALLIYLALSPGRRASREFLIELLWSDVPPDRARNALRQALFHLRRIVGDDTLPGSMELVLSAGVVSDRDRFLAALERDALGDAVDMYHGPFLSNFGVPGGAAFEHWADLERLRLQTGFVRAGEILVRRHLNGSHTREGTRIARLIRDRAPHEESGWRLVLEAAVSAQDFVTAAVEATALEEWAAADGLFLEPSTRAAITRARGVAPAPTGDPSAPQLMADLTGREREFALIITAWDAVRTGGARHLHISAPAGLGKTRLLRDATARLAAAGAVVASVRGAPGDRDVPYAFAADLAAQLVGLPGAAGIAPASAQALLALNPALSATLAGIAETVPHGELLRRRIYALSDLIHAIAHERRFVLVIDDLHWVDAASVRVIEGLLARLGNAPVLCLTASRPERRAGLERSTVLHLSTLDPSQVGALVAALGTLPPDKLWAADLAAGLHAATGGSPLLLLETLRLALDQRILTLAGQEWECGDAERLRGLLLAGEALRERVRSLADGPREVLVLLATAGIPLDRTALARMTGMSEPMLDTALAQLEQQGFAVQAVHGWLPAHDEMAAAAREALDDASRVRAEARVGEFLATGARDRHTLLRAAQHLGRAGQHVRLRDLFRQYLRECRAHGEHRGVSELALEFGARDEQEARALAASIPAWWRTGLWSRPRQVAAVASLLLLPSLTAGAIWQRNTRDAGLQRLLYTDSAGRVTALTMREADWSGSQTPLASRRASSRFADAAFDYAQFPPAISPDGRSAAWVQDSGDSTTLDVWIRTPAGTRRLTHAAGDDLAFMWLPDGSALVGVSGRWSGEGDYDIAVFDTATGYARQVTRSREHEGAPRPSPDGTRIAFTREDDNMQHQLCVVLVDGRDEPSCRFAAGRSVLELLGWTSASELALVVDEGARRPLVIHDWARDRSTEILGPQVARGRLSPDGRWIAANVRVPGVHDLRDWVVPVDRPSRARPVASAAHEATDVRWWEGPADATAVVHRVEFTDTAHTLTLGASTRLALRAVGPAGREVALHVLPRWWSSDSTIATVDSTGEVWPTAGGLVTITASLVGGLRTARTFRVLGDTAHVALEEHWGEDWAERWISWGDPAPRVVRGPAGIRAFANGGDGVFQSMAVSRQAFRAERGLGLEVRVSTPVTRLKWQRLRTLLVAGVDTAALRAGDQRKAAPSGERWRTLCGTTFPQSGPPSRRMAMFGGSSWENVSLGEGSEVLSSGAWWTLRLQLLPDGRCGVAVNGRVVWLAQDPGLLTDEVRVRLGDESVGTDLLHGPLTVWTGVRTDVRWVSTESNPELQ